MKIVFFLHIFHVTFIKFTTSAESCHLCVLNAWYCQLAQNKYNNSKIHILVFLTSGGHYLNVIFLLDLSYTFIFVANSINYDNPPIHFKVWQHHSS